VSKLSIKVIIAGRSYPLMVQENELEKIQQAAQDINQAIDVLQKNYAVRDMQDLLAMTSLQLAIKVVDNQQVFPNYSIIEQELQKISDELDTDLEKIQQEE